MTDKIVVIFGEGKPMKHSVRMKPLSVEGGGGVVNVSSLGDYYVSRDVMKELGLKDTDTIRITFQPDSELL